MRFLFVDSIDELTLGKRARGHFTMPRDFAPPACLVAEAIGQLAGWIAMEHSEFSARPVAGLVGQCVIAGEARPGESVALAVEMDECEADAVSYAGSARADGQTIVTLERCGAPMLPLADFDDRDAMRARFAALRSPEGAHIEVDRELARPLPLSEVTFESASATALLITPAEPQFYADHFPNRPVFPATLLLDAEIRLARLFAGRLGFEGRAARPLIRVIDVKLRTFIAPGQKLELAAMLRARDSASLNFALTVASAGKRIATANLTFEWS
jgi:3-hydroxymyristoyl/3-hydroxydecanoyl-(acyl carrier protein) dehydratase